MSPSVAKIKKTYFLTFTKRTSTNLLKPMSLLVVDSNNISNKTESNANENISDLTELNANENFSDLSIANSHSGYLNTAASSNVNSNTDALDIISNDPVVLNPDSTSTKAN